MVNKTSLKKNKSEKNADNFVETNEQMGKPEKISLTVSIQGDEILRISGTIASDDGTGGAKTMSLHEILMYQWRVLWALFMTTLRSFPIQKRKTLCELCGISRTAFYRYLKGRCNVPFEVIKKILHHPNCTAELLNLVEK